MHKVLVITVWMTLLLVACCNPPATQSLDSSFTGNITSKLGPNQYVVLYGSRPLTLIFEKAVNFEIGQRLYIKGRLAEDIVKVNEATLIR